MFFPPSLFFFLAVLALSALERELAFARGRHLSGFFLSLLVPHGPSIEPSVPILTHFCSLHFFSSPILFGFAFTFISTAHAFIHNSFGSVSVIVVKSCFKNYFVHYSILIIQHLFLQTNHHFFKFVFC